MSLTLRFLDHKPGSYFLFGPRGTGKTTWLSYSCPDASTLDFLDPAIFRRYSAYPERLIEFAAGADPSQPIIIDEVQRIPQVLTVVHSLIEQRKELRFILTGSSARKLKQTGVDLLGGRAALQTIHPFMAAELGDLFDLEKYLTFGGVPLIYMSETPAVQLQGYIDLYLEQEIRNEGIIRKIGDFNRFLEAVSFSHGQVLNTAAIARECGVSRNTVESYLRIIEDLLIAVRMPVFTKRAKRATISHQKFYFFDCGVYRSIRPTGPLDPQGDLSGPALEGMVMQHLRAWISYGNRSLNLYYWHTRAGNEVDFIVYGNDGFFAIEVKASGTVRPEDLRGLKAFLADYPESTAYLLYGGTERLMIDAITCIPVKDFLQRLRPEGIDSLKT